MGFDVTHVYGLTETYRPGGRLRLARGMGRRRLPNSARLKARQGVRYAVLDGLIGRRPETMEPVPRDGETMGEIMLPRQHRHEGLPQEPERHRGPSPAAGSIPAISAVLHPDGYIEIKDRSKDIIISGGENISLLEVEEVLYRHPAVLEAAVVARPDDEVGRDPLRLRHAEGGAERHGGRAHRVLPRADGAVQGAAHGGPRDVAEDRDRQGPEIVLRQQAKGLGEPVLMACPRPGARG